MFDTMLDWIERNYLRATLAILTGLVLVFLAVFASLARAADATISWTMPTQRVDGTALTAAELANTQIAYGVCVAGQVPAVPVIATVAAPAVSTVVTGLGYGTWCFAVRVTDTGARQSDYTGQVTKVVLAPPKPPTLVTVATVAYEIKLHPVEGVILGRMVGTVPRGTPCVESDPLVGADYYEVGLDLVTLAKMPKSAVVVAKCEVT